MKGEHFSNLGVQEFRLQATGYRLQITDNRLQTAGYRVRVCAQGLRVEIKSANAKKMYLPNKYTSSVKSLPLQHQT